MSDGEEEMVAMSIPRPTEAESMPTFSVAKRTSVTGKAPAGKG